jgi:2,4'-dihydroxyacetophenone dioxygenase
VPLIAVLLAGSVDIHNTSLGVRAAGTARKNRVNIGQLDCRAWSRMYTGPAVGARARSASFKLCAQPLPEDHMAIVDAKSSLASVIQEYGRPDIHIGAGEDESPYVPFKENVFIRHLAFDVRTNSFANILWVKKGGMLGRHRHRGPISACTLEGSWRYLEYDWVARPGSYVRENPGVIHTLVSDDPNGMKTIFFLNGSLEFYDDNDVLLDTLDVFWFIDHYLNHCRAHGLKINEKLWI